MAATAHSDPYAIFMRKIGYSVGLERTLERVGDLVELYTENKDITAASWKELVYGSEHWGLRTDNISNVFYSLRLIQKNAGDILVLENLDAMAIASTMLKDAREQDAARAFLLLWAILVNDGEIFINLLLAGFEENKIKEKLSSMILQKRAALKAVLSGKGYSKQINRIITIDRQEKNKGNSGDGRSIASQKRTEPLQPRTEPLQPERTNAIDVRDADAIEFSEDYFRKVPPRRKDWARSLGLWDDGSGLTQRGKDFIDGLARAGYIDSNNLFTYWPMDYELVRAGFRPDLLDKDPKTLWGCLIDFGTAYTDLRVRPPSKGDADEAVDLIRKMMKIFRTLHVRKAMLRREVSITVAYPAAVARACATGEPILDLPTAITTEQRGDKRRIAFRQSRNTGGALSVKR